MVAYYFVCAIVLVNVYLVTTDRVDELIKKLLDDFQAKENLQQKDNTLKGRLQNNIDQDTSKERLQNHVDQDNQGNQMLSDVRNKVDDLIEFLGITDISKKENHEQKPKGLMWKRSEEGYPKPQAKGGAGLMWKKSEIKSGPATGTGLMWKKSEINSGPAGGAGLMWKRNKEINEDQTKGLPWQRKVSDYKPTELVWKQDEQSNKAKPMKGLPWKRDTNKSEEKSPSKQRIEKLLEDIIDIFHSSNEKEQR